MKSKSLISTFIYRPMYSLKYLVLISNFFILFNASAQNPEIDSLTLILKKLPSTNRIEWRDTIKLKLLVQMGEVCELEDILKYEIPALEIADKLLSLKPNPQLRIRILGEKESAFNGMGMIVPLSALVRLIFARLILVSSAPITTTGTMGDLVAIAIRTNPRRNSWSRYLSEVGLKFPAAPSGKIITSFCFLSRFSPAFLFASSSPILFARIRMCGPTNHNGWARIRGTRRVARLISFPTITASSAVIPEWLGTIKHRPLFGTFSRPSTSSRK